MIDKSTRIKIKGFLEGFIQGLMDEAVKDDLDPALPRPSLTESKQGKLKPFHEAILPHGVLLVQEFERSFSTKLGNTFEEVAKMIGERTYICAERSHKVIGPVSAQAIKKIESIVNQMNRGLSRSFLDLVDEVVALADAKGNKRRRIADLYLKDTKGSEIFFEIKSPKPNKGQCLEVTERLLQIHAIKGEKPPRVRTYYAMAYNPWGVDKKLYSHSFALRYLDMENQVVIGREFWDLVGGKGTYEEVLEIYREVGREKGPDMVDKLALGY